MGQLYILKIDIDGHFHGGEPVKPWVAQVTGPDRKYGLARTFVDAKNDWSQASRSMRGNIYGRVACFPLRDGNLYEVQRCRGNPSKRHVVREFLAIEGGKRVPLEPLDALARLDGGGPAARLELAEDREGTSWVARLRGLGTPDPVAFAVVDGERLYRLRPGVYEVMEQGSRRFVGVQVDGLTRLKEQEAWEWLTTKRTA
jgi:hypothetical protein